MLISLIIGIYILHYIFPYFSIDTTPLWIISVSILGYNILFHRFWHKLPAVLEKNKFNSLHFSLIQIICDFIALLIFIYFTGGVETPLFALFIFHVIIGSLFLTGSYISLIVSGTLLVAITGSILEFNGIVPHHTIQGFLDVPLYNNASYLVIYFALFGLSLYMSVYLANSIAKPLYQRERALTLAYEELENAEKSKTRYVMSVVHDLKTPIAAVTTYINMILEGTLGVVHEEQKRPLERSKHRLDGAITMINDILNISQLKLESGIENVTDVNLTAVFLEIYEETRDMMSSKNIQYNFIFDESENFTIQAEPKLLKMALGNLVSNACKYTEQGGIIEITLKAFKKDVTISVADNGIGIPFAEKDKIFEDFYRSTVSKRKGIEGTGLGMSIVMQVINKLNGEITVESPCYLAQDESHSGTQFIVRLPKEFYVINPS